MEHQERLDAALAQDQGVLLLFAHFGANQMIMPAVGYRGYKMCQMSAPPTTWNKIFKGFRDSPMRERGRALRWACEESLPVTHINIFGSLKTVFTHLKQKEIVGLAMDGGGGQDRMQFPFLGNTIHLSPGAMRIALRAACPVLPVFMVSTPEGPSVMHIEEPLVLDRSLPKEECLRAGIATFVKLLEAQVAAHPSHYLSFMAWRTQNVGLGEPAFLTAGSEG
jgi:KDO2-lipid IV(A) lauroyltransferase